jgi:ribosomal protein S6--L-glutamate ligase
MQEGTAILLKNLPGGRQVYVAAGQSRPRLMLCFLIDDSLSPVTSPVLVTVINILARQGFQVETINPEDVVTRPDSLGSIHDLYIMKSNTELSLSLAGILHTQGARMLNPYMSCITTQDKIVASQLLHAAGVPVPSSWVTSNLTLLQYIVEQTPVVIKPHRGHRGAGVRLVQNADEMALISPPRTPVLIQKFVQGNGEDLKIYVVNEEVFAVRNRVPPLGFRPYIEMPSQPGEPCEVSSELRDIALRCGRILGLGLYGLDVIETTEGPFVVDVDSFPSYQGVPNIAPLIADYIRGYALGWFNLEPLGLNAQAETELSEKEIKDSGTAVEEAIFLTEFLQTSATIRQDLEKGADSAANTTTQEAQPVRIHYPHTMPEHGSQIVDEGKWKQAPKKGVVFQNSDVKLLFDALGNSDHEYRLVAEKAMRGFTKDVKRGKVTSLNQTSRDLSIPHKNLSEWVAKGLIPYEYRDKNAIYLAKDVAQELGRDNQEAKEMGIQTARLLRERYEKYFPPEPQSRPEPETLKVVYETGKIQGKKEQTQTMPQSYEIVTTLRQAAEKTGVPLEEIMTTRDIQAEFDIKKARVNRWSRSGHLMPLPVRLKGSGEGGQRVYRRSDIEGVVANPPKGGRPPK